MTYLEILFIVATIPVAILAALLASMLPFGAIANWADDHNRPFIHLVAGVLGIVFGLTTFFWVALNFQPWVLGLAGAL